jgi:thiol-disulfide isomerase/thioredoxin
MLATFLVSLRLFINNETKSDFINVSQTFPVLALFYSHHCGHCVKLYPTWENFSSLYAADPKIILAECDCVNYSSLCTEFGPVNGYPTFAIYLAGKRVRIHVDRTVEALSALAEDLKATDLSFPCARHWGQADSYPYLIFSFPDDDKTACNKLHSISNHLPNFTSHLLLAKSNPEPQIEIILDASYHFTRPGLLNHTATVAFVTDFSHSNFGPWPLSESHQITFRRFAFIVFHEEWRIHRVQTPFMALGDELCTGKVNISIFHEDYPDIELSEGDCPAVAITNEDQSKFTLMKGVTSSDGLADRLARILNGTEDVSWSHSYKYYRPRAAVVVTERQKQAGNGGDSRKIEYELPMAAGFGVVVLLLLVCAAFQRPVRRTVLTLMKRCTKSLARPAKNPMALL